MPDAVDDRRLIEGCLARDARSWDLFVERFSRLIYWAIHRTLDRDPPGGRAEFCREVFQELFQRLTEKEELAKLRNAGSIRRFLVVSASHAASDRLRALQRQSRDTLSLDEIVRQGKETPPAYETTFAASPEELDGVLREALSGLKAKERACLELHIVQEKELGEVALLLGMPVETVRTVVRRAKDKLKDKLDRRGYEKNI